MKAVILAGGLGTRISEETHLKPKPMIEIGGRPILWHIMKIYAAHGVNEFIICCGYKGYLIKEYFYNYFIHMSDITIDLTNNGLTVHNRKAEDWKVTLVDTGESSMTGGRLRRVRDYLGDSEFCFTYGDGVADIDIRALLAFHRAHGRKATVTAVRPPGRYGALMTEGDKVLGFAEKPRGDGGLINGGFFVLDPSVIDYIADDDVSWELAPMERLAQEGELMAWTHEGFWQPMDTLREKNLLEEALGLRQGAVEDVVTSPAAPFWQGRRVLLTGHTGFKGAWLALWLERLGASVTGVALAPATQPSLFDLAGIGERVENHLCDIRDAAALAAIVRKAEPEIVVHLAAQPLVRPGYARPLETFETNIIGTANLLDALRHVTSVRVVVAVTTDKVYHNLETSRPYREDDRLGGHDPYSASKACAELIASCYRDAFLRARDVRLATARAGNVIGGGDWSEDRLIPDAVRAWQSDAPLLVRNPAATRPWQHVLDPLAAYLRLAELLWDHADLADGYNFGPDAEGAAPVRAVIERAQAAYGQGETHFAEAPSGPHEAGLLALDNSHAREALGIAPRWPLDEAIRRTMIWYRELHGGADAAALCLADIQAYEGAA